MVHLTGSGRVTMFYTRELVYRSVTRPAERRGRGLIAGNNTTTTTTTAASQLATEFLSCLILPRSARSFCTSLHPESNMYNPFFCLYCALVSQYFRLYNLFSFIIFTFLHPSIYTFIHTYIHRSIHLPIPLSPAGDISFRLLHCLNFSHCSCVVNEVMGRSVYAFGESVGGSVYVKQCCEWK